MEKDTTLLRQGQGILTSDSVAECYAVEWIVGQSQGHLGLYATVLQHGQGILKSTMDSQHASFWQSTCILHHCHTPLGLLQTHQWLCEHTLRDGVGFPQALQVATLSALHHRDDGANGDESKSSQHGLWVLGQLQQQGTSTQDLCTGASHETCSRTDPGYTEIEWLLGAQRCWCVKRLSGCVEP